MLFIQTPFFKSISPQITFIISAENTHKYISGALNGVKVAKINASGRDTKVENPLSKIKVSKVFPPERKVK